MRRVAQTRREFLGATAAGLTTAALAVLARGAGSQHPVSLVRPAVKTVAYPPQVWPLSRLNATLIV